MSEYFNVIKAALEDVTGRTVEVGENTHLTKDNVLDSLDSMVFLLNVEKATGIALPEKDVEQKDLFKVANLMAFFEANKK